MHAAQDDVGQNLPYLQDMYVLSVQSALEQGQALHVCSLKRLSCKEDQKYKTDEQSRPT